MARPSSGNHEDKSKPGIAFIINFPIVYQLSLPLKKQKELKTVLNSKNIEVSKIFRKKFLESFNVVNERELVTKYPGIKRKIRELRTASLDDLGTDYGEFSGKFGRIWADEILKEKG